MLPSGRTFYKMSGSGNDFVMVDAINHDFQDLMAPERVQPGEDIFDVGAQRGADDSVSVEYEISEPMLPLDHFAAPPTYTTWVSASTCSPPASVCRVKA